MFDDLLEQAAALRAAREPFVLATVVACRPPTSARPGAKAIIRADGGFTGWVGGNCAEPPVIQEALAALADGRPRLLLLSPDTEEGPGGLEGIVRLPMTCRSEGALEIYMEPFLPPWQLVVIGASPVAQSLAALGRHLGFSVSACDPAAGSSLFPDADLLASLDEVRTCLNERSAVVVATMGHYDEEALEAVAGGRAGYIGLVGSPRRGAAVLGYLRERGVAGGKLSRVKCPAGLNIGAETPEEIALSILAEIVEVVRTGDGHLVSTPAEKEPAFAEARDPVCGMVVDPRRARYSSDYGGRTIHFCALPCKELFDRSPADYIR